PTVDWPTLVLLDQSDAKRVCAIFGGFSKVGAARAAAMFAECPLTAAVFYPPPSWLLAPRGDGDLVAPKTHRVLPARWHARCTERPFVNIVYLLRCVFLGVGGGARGGNGGGAGDG